MWGGAAALARRGAGAGAARRLSSSGAAEVNVAVVGGSGYTGAELIRLLAGHPYAKVCAAPFLSEAALPQPPPQPLGGRSALGGRFRSDAT